MAHDRILLDDDDTLDISNLLDSGEVDFDTGTLIGSAYGIAAASGGKPGGTGDPGIGTFATINGGGGNDSLLGTSSNDVINGYGGADTLRGAGGLDTMYGGNDNDTFLYLNGEDALDGEILYGGAGSDKVLLQGAGVYDMRMADFSSIEEFEFNADGVNVDNFLYLGSIEMDQAGELPSNLLIDGNANTGSDNTIRVYLNSPLSDDVDISAWTFQDWNTFGGDVDNITIYGTSVANVIRGSSQNDGGIYGYGGADLLYGNAGNDIIYGGTENDTLYGGTGNDTLTGDAGNDYLSGSNGINSLYGSAGNDTIYGGNDNDSLYGGDDNDYMDGGAGVDNIYGGNGNDTIYGGADGGGTIDGGAGGDRIYWSPTPPVSAPRTVYGGADNDTIYGGNTNFGNVTFNLGTGTYTSGAFVETWAQFENYINAGTGGEDVIGTSGANYISTGSGANNLYGAAGEDTLYGGGGNDALYGGSADDTLYGGDGNNSLYGGFNTDIVYGGNDNDRLYVLDGEFFDAFYGGAGVDTLDHSDVTRSGDTFDFELGVITSTFDTGTPALSSIEVYLDGSGGNTIISDGNSHTYYGGLGDNSMVAEIGGETMYGGAGVDTIDLSRYNGQYIFDMGSGAVNFGNELFQGFEVAILGDGNDFDHRHRWRRYHLWRARQRYRDHGRQRGQQRRLLRRRR